MSSQYRPKLPLTVEEKSRIKSCKTKLADIHTLEEEQLVEIFAGNIERAKYIKGLVIFQQIPSIGYKLADVLVDNLRVYSLEEIKNENAMSLFDRLEEQLGYQIDPCVEDQIRCVIYYANHSNSSKQWFDFTEERKHERKQLGYPKSRPNNNSY